MKEKGFSRLFISFINRELMPEAESIMMEDGKWVRSGAAAWTPAYGRAKASRIGRQLPLSALSALLPMTPRCRSGLWRPEWT